MTLVDPLSSLARARASVLRTSTAERVADAVREEVVEGRLRPGARLPEQTLCDALGVSRNTVREALSQLVNERVEVSGPGFINLYLAPTWLHDLLRGVVAQGEQRGGQLRMGRLGGRDRRNGRRNVGDEADTNSPHPQAKS